MNDLEFIQEILSQLKIKGNLSEPESDLLSSLEEYVKNPFDRKSTEKRIDENNLKYPAISIVIDAVPGIEIKAFNDMTDIEVRNSLFLQIQALWTSICQVIKE